MKLVKTNNVQASHDLIMPEWQKHEKEEHTRRFAFANNRVPGLLTLLLTRQAAS